MKGTAGMGALEAHHERTKEKYASNPDINTAKSNRNFQIVKPETSYKRESDNRIETAECKTRKDSVRFVDTLITASPEFFKGKKREEIRAFFIRAAEFMTAKVGAGNIFAAIVHMDEKTPHTHLCFLVLYPDNRGRTAFSERSSRRPKRAHPMAGRLFCPYGESVSRP